MLHNEMSVKVKICGITNPADGLAAAEAGADALGFVFYDKSPRNISVTTAAGIIRQLPAFLVKVGVFVNAPADLVVRAVGECGLGLLQFHGEETPDYCLQFGVMSMKAFRLGDTATLQTLKDYPTDAWLLDACTPDKLGGTGERCDWEAGGGGAKAGPAHFPGGRADAGERRRGSAPGASLRRGCLQWRGSRPGPQRPGQGPGVCAGGQERRRPDQ